MAKRKPSRTRKTAGKRKTRARRASSRSAPPAPPAPAARRVFVERHGPETLRLLATSPSLTVDDLEKSLRFYTDALGFMERERWKDDKGGTTGVMLLAGTCELGLFQDDWAKGRDRKKGVGFSVWCETTQDVDALAERVKGAGFPLASDPKDEWGSRSFAVQDPDGFRLVLYREK